MCYICLKQPLIYFPIDSNILKFIWDKGLFVTSYILWPLCPSFTIRINCQRKCMNKFPVYTHTQSSKLQDKIGQSLCHCIVYKKLMKIKCQNSVLYDRTKQNLASKTYLEDVYVYVNWHFNMLLKSQPPCKAPCACFWLKTWSWGVIQCLKYTLR